MCRFRSTALQGIFDWADSGTFLLQHFRICLLGMLVTVFTFASSNSVPLKIISTSATADPTIYTNGEVRAMFLYDSILYIGGTFSEVHDAVGFSARRGLASLDLRTNRFTSFKADIERGNIRAITVGYGSVFAGGQFSSVNSVRCGNLVALDPKSGKVQSDFTTKEIQTDGPVFAAICTDSMLFIGGNFRKVGSDSVHYLAAIDVRTRKPVTWFDLNPDDSMDINGKMVGGVWTLAIHSIDSSVLFAGGNFQRVNGIDNGRGLFAFRSDGSPGPAFLTPITDPAVSITCKGSTLYAGMGGASNRVDAYDISSKEEIGRLWKGFTAEGDVQAVACSDNGYVYFAFHQGLFDTTDFYRCAVLDAETGNLYDTIPSMNSFFGVWSLLSTDTFLFAGGAFTRFNGKRQNYFAKIDVRDYPMPFPPGQVLLGKPLDNSDNVAAYSRLSWCFTAFAETYELQLSKNRLFDPIEREFTGMNVLDKRIQDVEPGTTYYWKVRARNTAGFGPWSDKWSFTSAFDTRRSPGIICPQQDSLYDPIYVICTWNSLLNAVAYEIEISEDANFVTKLFTKTAITDTSITAEKLTHDAKYYFRVRAVFPSAESEWSATSFATTAAPVERLPPELLHPEHLSGEAPCQVDFEWKNQEKSSVNIVWVSKDSLCNELIVDTVIYNKTTLSYTFNEPDQKYYWKVAQVISNENKWSSVSSFSTLNCRWLAPVELLPVPESIILADSITLEWKDPIKGASIYRIEIDTSMEMATPLIVATITDTVYRLHTLSDSTDYFWRVKIVPPVGTGNYTAIQKFSTVFQKPLPPSPITKHLPDRFRVQDAYVAGAFCHVRIDIAGETTVHLNIYDFSGRRISMQSYNDLTPESYLLSFPLRTIGKGHFIMTVDAGTFHKNIPLLKMW